MQVDRELVKSNLLDKLLPVEGLDPERRAAYMKDQEVVDDVIAHLEMAHQAYHETQNMPKPATADKLRKAQAKLKALRTAMADADSMAVNRFMATPDPAPDSDEIARYGQKFGPMQDFKKSVAELHTLIDRIEKHLVEAERAVLPKSSPDFALRNAIAPLLALYRQHNPNAELTRDNRATNFLCDALALIGIEGSARTIGVMDLAEFPFHDW